MLRPILWSVGNVVFSDCRFILCCILFLAREQGMLHLLYLVLKPWGTKRRVILVFGILFGQGCVWNIEAMDIGHKPHSSHSRNNLSRSPPRLQIDLLLRRFSFLRSLDVGSAVPLPPSYHAAYTTTSLSPKKQFR